MNATEKLGDVFDIRKGKKAAEVVDQPTAGSVPYIQIDEVRGVAPTKYAIDPKPVVATENDLCIVWDGANAGTIGYGVAGAVGSTVARMRLKRPDEWDSRFLGRLLEGRFPQLNQQAQGRGATIPHVDKGKLEEIEFPKIPRIEQRRIAAILDKADAIRRKREQALTLADDFLRSVFLEMFGDPSTNPKGWPMGTIRDLVTEAKYGTSTKADVTVGRYPVLRMGNLTSSGNIVTDDLKYCDLADNEVEKYTVRKGDILFNRTNSPDLVGKTAVFQLDGAYAYAGYLVRARTNQNADPHYISFFLNSKYGKAILRGMCKSIIGMANINAQEFQNIQIPMPPISLQKQFRGIVERMGKTEHLHRQDLKHAEDLFASLSQRAFRGEL